MLIQIHTIYSHHERASRGLQVDLWRGSSIFYFYFWGRDVGGDIAAEAPALLASHLLHLQPFHVFGSMCVSHSRAVILASCMQALWFYQAEIDSGYTQTSSLYVPRHLWGISPMLTLTHAGGEVWVVGTFSPHLENAFDVIYTSTQGSDMYWLRLPNWTQSPWDKAEGFL